MTIVPAIISKTFQLMTDGSIETGSIPAARKATAVTSAIYGLYLGAAIIRTYMSMNIIKAVSFIQSLPEILYYRYNITVGRQNELHAVVNNILPRYFWVYMDI
jgi:hypothetical protein